MAGRKWSTEYTTNPITSLDGNEIAVVSQNQGGGVFVSAAILTKDFAISTATLGGALIASNNLSDLTNVATARINIGLSTAGGDLSGTFPNPSVISASTSVAGKVQLATSAQTTSGLAVQASDTRLSDSRTPSGAAGGSLSGSFPSPSLATASARSIIANTTAGTASPTAFQVPINSLVGTNASTLGSISAGTGISISGGSISTTGAAPTGAAGGDLSGSFPNPSVVSASTSTAGKVQLATSAQTTAGLAVQASDTRLSDSRTPSGSAGGVLAGNFPNPTFSAISALSVLANSTASSGVPAALSLAANTLLGNNGSTLGAITAGSGITISGGTISSSGSSPTGAAGGSLSGIYPNPTLAAIAALSVLANATGSSAAPAALALAAGSILGNTGTALGAITAGTGINISGSTISSTVTGGIKTLNMQFSGTPGSFTYTPTTNMLYCWVIAIGGGGGGGGSTGGGSTASGASGGCGSGVSMSILSALTIGASKAVVVGAGGTAGPSGNNAGGAGGNTTFGATLVVCNGGTGGVGSSGTAGGRVFSGNPAAQGIGTFATRGTPGGYGDSTVSGFPAGGAGGAGPMGGGALNSTASTGSPGGVYGAGGGGASSTAAGVSNAGGAGGAGCMLIIEFIG